MTEVSRPLEAIFFDIDDTLFSTTVFADKARRAAVDAMTAAGLGASPLSGTARIRSLSQGPVAVLGTYRTRNAVACKHL